MESLHVFVSNQKNVKQPNAEIMNNYGIKRKLYFYPNYDLIFEIYMKYEIAQVCV